MLNASSDASYNQQGGVLKIGGVVTGDGGSAVATSIGTLQHDMGVADAGRAYAMLTVGDGLVAQVPALMLSTATGIIVMLFLRLALTIVLHGFLVKVLLFGNE